MEDVLFFAISVCIGAANPVKRVAVILRCSEINLAKSLSTALNHPEEFDEGVFTRPPFAHAARPGGAT
jgi:hypothetical protein